MLSKCSLLIFVQFFHLLTASCPPRNIYKCVDLPGACPKLVYVENPLLNAFFYSNYAFPDIRNLGCNGDCATINLSRQNATYSSYTECCRKGSVNSCFDGFDVIEPDSSLSYYVNGEKKYGYVLDSDNYESFEIFYHCELDCYGNRVEEIRINTKYSCLPEELKNHAFAILRANDIDPEQLVYVPQPADCPV